MWRDISAGVVVALFALVYLLTALQLPSSVGQSNGLGPRAFPLVVATLLLTGAAALGGRATWHRGRTPPGPTNADSNEPSEPPATVVHKKMLVSIVALTLLYLAVMGLLDFVVTTTGYLLVGVLVIRAQRPHSVRQLLVPVLFAVVTAVTVYLVFAVGLNLGLPAGPVARMLGT